MDITDLLKDYAKRNNLHVGGVLEVYKRQIELTIADIRILEQTDIREEAYRRTMTYFKNRSEVKTCMN